MDLFLCIIGERAVEGGLVGPLAAAMLGAQFADLKDCDRFFYAFTGAPWAYSPRFHSVTS